MNWLFMLDLKLLDNALLLDFVDVSSKHAVHRLELCNFLVSEAPSANTDSKAERTQSIFFDILMTVVIFDAAIAILSAADVLVI